MWQEAGTYGNGTTNAVLENGTELFTDDWGQGNTFTTETMDTPTGTGGTLTNNGSPIQEFVWVGGGAPPGPGNTWSIGYSADVNVQGDGVHYTILAPWISPQPVIEGDLNSLLPGVTTFTTSQPSGTVEADVQSVNVNGTTIYHLYFTINVSVTQASNIAGSTWANSTVAWQPGTSPSLVS